jgi:hypothetical protein
MKTKVEPITDIVFCRFLRAKNPYGKLEGGDNPWLLKDDANSIYRCILSTSGAGPDNGLVAPNCCVSGRSCFEQPKEK